MPTPASDLRERLSELGRSLGAREAEHRGAMEEARAHAEKLRAVVADGLEAFHAAAGEAGAPGLAIDLSTVRTDDKHLRAIEFDLTRGRHRAIVTVKARGDVTLVGPFHAGKTEGPCKTFPWQSEGDLHAALGDFLARFLEEAASP